MPKPIYAIVSNADYEPPSEVYTGIWLWLEIGRINILPNSLEIKDLTDRSMAFYL